MSVFIWNYRGYGRSKGKPSMDKIKKDGEVLVNYLRTQRLVKRLGVHGESLGGCIAVHLAKECELDFLIADRTFSSLSAVVYFNYGKLAYWMYRLGRGEDCESVTDFLDTNCYKIIMSDSEDKMINDLSSLKSAVALNLIYPKTDILNLGYLYPRKLSEINYILSSTAISSCIDSLNRLKQFLSCLDDEKKSVVLSDYFRKAQANKYQAIVLQTDKIHEESLLSSLERLFEVVNRIEAAGKSFFDILSGSHNKLAFVIWLFSLDIWGSGLVIPGEKLTSHMKSVNSIRSGLQEIQSILDEYEKSENIIIQQVFKDINIVFNAFIEILGAMEERCGISSDLDETLDKIQIDYSKAGVLIPLSCGHSGMLNSAEKYFLSKYIQDYTAQKFNK